MVGKIGFHDGFGLALADPPRSVIYCLIKPVIAPGTFAGKQVEVCCGGMWHDHGRQSGCIGCNHHIVRQTPLQSQTRNTEVGVLVGEFNVTRIECRF